MLKMFPDQRFGQSILRRIEQARAVYWLFFLIFFGALIYRTAIGLYFFQDDFVWISRAKDFATDWRLIFSPDISGFFMPVVHIYFALASRLFGLESGWYYAANIVWHGFNSFLLFMLVNKMAKNRRTAIFSALFFVSFRYSMEAIVWISAVTELMSASWLLGIGLTWIHYLESAQKRWYIAALVLSLVFIFTKEWSALVVPFLMLLGMWQLADNKVLNFTSIRRLLVRLAPFLVIFALYFLFELLLQQDQSPVISKGYYVLGWHAIPNIAGNFLLSFIPLVDAAHQHARLWLVASAVTLFAVFCVGIYCWRTRRDNALLLCALWIIVAFVPTSFFTWDPFISRYNYLPAIGTAIFLGSVINHLTRSKQVILSVGAVFLAGIYIGTNMLFISKMIRLYYAPVHVESRKFTEALVTQSNSLQGVATLGIYPNTPHKSFILPEVLHALSDVSPERVKVLAPEAPCSGVIVCLQWEPENKTVRLIKP